MSSGSLLIDADLEFAFPFQTACRYCLKIVDLVFARALLVYVERLGKNNKYTKELREELAKLTELPPLPTDDD